MTAHGLYYNSEATRTKRTGEEVTRSSAGEAGSREQAFDSIGVGKLNITPSGSTPYVQRERKHAPALPEVGGAENREQLDPLRIPASAAR